MIELQVCAVRSISPAVWQFYRANSSAFWTQLRKKAYSYSRRKCILLLLPLLLVLLRQTGDQLNGGAIFFLRRAMTVINDPALARRNLRSIIRLLFFDFLFFDVRDARIGKGRSLVLLRVTVITYSAMMRRKVKRFDPYLPSDDTRCYYNGDGEYSFMVESVTTFNFTW